MCHKRRAQLSLGEPIMASEDTVSNAGGNAQGEVQHRLRLEECRTRKELLTTVHPESASGNRKPLRLRFVECRPCRSVHSGAERGCGTEEVVYAGRAAPSLSAPQRCDRPRSQSVIDTRPCRIAIVAASVRSDTSSFSMMLLTWFRAVLSLIPNARPISLFVRPFATSCNT